MKKKLLFSLNVSKVSRICSWFFDEVFYDIYNLLKIKWKKQNKIRRKTANRGISLFLNHLQFWIEEDDNWNDQCHEGRWVHRPRRIRQSRIICQKRRKNLFSQRCFKWTQRTFRRNFSSFVRYTAPDPGPKEGKSCQRVKNSRKFVYIQSKFLVELNSF